MEGLCAFQAHAPLLPLFVSTLELLQFPELKVLSESSSHSYHDEGRNREEGGFITFYLESLVFL